MQDSGSAATKRGGGKREVRPIATAHDVARVAGVSQSAVSRAFTSGASISAATREKVMEAVAALGYRPNVLARSLITRRSNIIGVGMGNVENPGFALLLDEISRRLSQRGRQVLLFTTRPNAPADQEIEALLRYRVDAIVLLSAVMSSRLADLCAASGIPVILCNRSPRPESSMYGVSGDNFGGGRAIGHFLLRAGYRRMAFMAGYEASFTSQARERGFRDLLAEQGAAPPLRAVGEFTHEGAVRAARSLLSRRDRPEAIFCANDQMAFATIETARHEFGLRIGDDLGVVGFDDLPMASWPDFALTTYTQSFDGLAERIVDFAVGIGNPPLDRNATVPGRLAIRASTRLPPDAPAQP